MGKAAAAFWFAVVARTLVEGAAKKMLTTRKALYLQGFSHFVEGVVRLHSVFL